MLSWSAAGSVCNRRVFRARPRTAVWMAGRGAARGGEAGRARHGHAAGPVAAVAAPVRGPHPADPDPRPAGGRGRAGRGRGRGGRTQFPLPAARKSVVSGKSVSVSVYLGGRRLIKKKKKK